MLYTELDIASIVHTDMKPPPRHETITKGSWYTTSKRMTVSKLATAELKQKISIYYALTKYSLHAGVS